MNLAKLQSQLQQPQGAPVEKWDPPFCGDIDITIKRDGQWLYMGSPIGRHTLVKLFASVLRKQAHDYYLVTPAEKVRIKVEDAPFVVTLMSNESTELGQAIVFQDNLGHQFTLDDEHYLWVETDPDSAEPAPYVMVRDNMPALIHRNVFYQLVEQAEIVEHAGVQEFFVTSLGKRFSLGKIAI